MTGTTMLLATLGMRDPTRFRRGSASTRPPRNQATGADCCGLVRRRSDEEPVLEELPDRFADGGPRTAAAGDLRFEDDWDRRGHAQVDGVRRRVTVAFRNKSSPAVLTSVLPGPHLEPSWICARWPSALFGRNTPGRGASGSFGGMTSPSSSNVARVLSSARRAARASNDWNARLLRAECRVTSLRLTTTPQDHHELTSRRLDVAVRGAPGTVRVRARKGLKP